SLHGQQLRDAAHRRHLHADPLQASRADAVPAQERPLPRRLERGRRQMTDDLRAAVAAGVLGAEESFHALLQSVVETARAIFGAKASAVFLIDGEAGGPV